MKHKPHSRKFDNIESASLRLAFLKENYRYRKFIEENRDRILTAYRELRSSFLERRAPNIPSVDRFGKEISHADGFRGLMAGGAIIPRDGSPVIKIPNPYPITKVHVWFHKRLEEDFGIVNPPFGVSIRSADGRREVLTADESWDLLDLMKDIDIVPKKKRETALQIMFSACGIREVVEFDEEAMDRLEAPTFFPQQENNNDVRDGKDSAETRISVFELEVREKQKWMFQFLTDGELEKRLNEKRSPFPLSALLPHERLLIVDLRKKKSELLKEFGTYLERTTHPWKLDTKRDREQAWRHLEIWKMVTHRGMKFKEIATELNIRVYTAEFSFKQAHIHTQWFPCPPWELLTLRKFEKSALANICKKCDKHSDRGWDCEFAEECEEFKRYVDQDSRHEIRGTRNAPLVPSLADNQILGNAVWEGKAPLRERVSEHDREKKGVVLRKAVKKKDDDALPVKKSPHY